MTQIKLMHAKLHRFKVTEANVNYAGSITIEQRSGKPRRFVAGILTTT